MTTIEIVAGFTSKDPHEVWKAASEIVAFCQDLKTTEPLIPYLSEIRNNPKGLEMGGAFAPNRRFVDFSIKAIEFYKDSEDCPCFLYEELEVFNQQKEEKKEFIRIDKTVLLEGKWVDFYEAVCTRCEQKFKILEREGHYMWWKWEIIV